MSENIIDFILYIVGRLINGLMQVLQAALFVAVLAGAFYIIYWVVDRNSILGMIAIFTVLIFLIGDIP